MPPRGPTPRTPMNPTKVSKTSDLIARIRRQLALSQEDLARQLGVSFATVNRWETGRCEPSRLAKVQIQNFCTQMSKRGKLVLPVEPAA